MLFQLFRSVPAHGNMAVIAADADEARGKIADEYGMDVAAVEVEQRWMHMELVDGEPWWKFCRETNLGAVAWWVEVV